MSNMSENIEGDLWDLTCPNHRKENKCRNCEFFEECSEFNEDIRVDLSIFIERLEVVE